MLPIWLDAWPVGPVARERSDRELANHPDRSPFEGGLGRRCREHVMGAHGCDRCSAADRVRQHRESHARAGGRAAAGVRRARRARRSAVRESRESCWSRAWCWAQPAARSAWCSHTLAYRFSSPSARAIAAPSRRSPSIRPCSRSPWRSRSRRPRVRLDHGTQARTARRYAHRAACRAARARAASAAQPAAHWSSCRWRSRSCWS